MAGKIQKDRRVAVRESEIHRAAVISVDDPRVTLEQSFDLRPPNVFFGLDPACAPVMPVKVDHREPAYFAKAP